MHKGEKNWAAFAPGFHEIEENVIYQEKPDEFDPATLEREAKAAMAMAGSGGGAVGVVASDAHPVNVVEPDIAIFSEDEEVEGDRFTQNTGYFISPSLPIEVKL